jgi:uncharacterized phage protein gp47/JayE
MTNGDTVDYGVTDQGFIVKPFQSILNDAFARAQLLFGPDIDLRSSSSLRKLLELTSLEDALLWMQLDGVYNSSFTATASGNALDLLGTDIGLGRAHLPATGGATFKLTNAAPTNCVYSLPPGTLVETAPPAAGVPPQRFRLLSKITLVKHNPLDGSEQVTASVQALVPGSDGNIAAQQLTRLNPTFAARYLNFDSSFVAVSNANPFSGGELYEDDSTYRLELYALPRTLWTVDAVRATVLALDGVRDALVYDPYGGLDQAAPPFGEFCFSDTKFQLPRELCNPYFFTITVAPNPGVLWEGDSDIIGLHEQILDALQPIRPISIFPTLALADIVQVAVRARVILQAGADKDTVLAAVRTALATYVSSLRLGDAVLYSQVLRVFTETPGIKDVQDLRLRRCPPLFAEIVFGPPAIFGNYTDIASLEAPCGGNLTLAAREVAVFAPDSPLLDIEVQSI